MTDAERDRKINELYDFMKAMQAQHSIPLNVEKALSYRLDIRSVPRVTTGSKGATSENVAVDESGSGTYSVLGPPDAFYQITDGQGNVGYVPKYN